MLGGSRSHKTNGFAVRDWTKGRVTRNLWDLSWPMLVSYVLMMIGPTIDMIWVGKLGPAAIGGVGVAGMGVLMIDTMRMGLLTGLRALIARYVGAGDTKSANHVANQAFSLLVAFSLVIAFVGVQFAEEMLGWLGLPPEVVATGAAYLRIQFIGSIAMSFRMVVDAIMQSSGDTMTPMKIALVFRLLHVALCPFLVFGWWIFPRMEVTGAAITAVVSQTVGMFLGLWVLYAGHSRLQPTLKGFRIDMRTIGRIVRIGIPSAVMGIQQNLGQFALMSSWLMGGFGTLALAAHAINMRVENVVTMPSYGFGMAAGVLAAQNLGAKQADRATEAGWKAALMVQGFMMFCAFMFFLFPQAIVSVFSAEGELLALTSDFIRIAAVSYLVMGLMAVFSQCVAAAGDTVRPMIIGFISIWLIQLPLSYVLAHYTNLGVYGIRWGMVVGMAVASAFYIIYFQSGKWKNRRITGLS